VPNGYIASGNTNGGVFGPRTPRRREVPGAETLDASLPAGAAPGGGVSLTPAAAGAAADDSSLSKAALKNKKKREAKKARDAEQKVDGTASGSNPASGHGTPQNGNGTPRNSSPNKRGHERTKSRGGQQNYNNHQQGPGSNNRLPIHNISAAADPFVPTPAPQSTQSKQAQQQSKQTARQEAEQNAEQEKKVRGLVKKLRAIDELKMRLAGGEKLEDTQVRKIQTEDGVRGELEKLGWTG
jgi:translation initiation factor 2A